MQDLLQNGLGLLQIIWINIILSGDNAVVIALACRGLPPKVRRTGMVLGAGVAIVLRVVFTLLVVALLDTPYLRLVGGLLLLWIAIKLLVEEEDGEGAVKETSRLWSAVWTVAVADMVMSLDNVLAIAAVAKGSTFLLIFGLVISIPLIVAGGVRDHDAARPLSRSGLGRRAAARLGRGRNANLRSRPGGAVRAGADRRAPLPGRGRGGLHRADRRPRLEAPETQSGVTERAGSTVVLAPLSRQRF